MRCNFDVAIGEKMLNIFKKEHKYETKSQKRNGVITLVCCFFSQLLYSELFRIL
jgi:hypothetical protein